jgi:hypothetical protein
MDPILLETLIEQNKILIEQNKQLIKVKNKNYLSIKLT